MSKDKIVPYDRRISVQELNISEELKKSITAKHKKFLIWKLLNISLKRKWEWIIVSILI